MTTRYSIGIDLGTTNSALAYVPLVGSEPAGALAIPQWETPGTLVEAPTLPSFLYLPEDALTAQLGGRATETQGWIAGRLARRRAGEAAGRVARSAKSWLCHHTADRSAAILPWGSEELAPAQKISPVRAAAFILNHLRGAWDSHFAQSGCAFDDQDITITVPASFDAAAQRLTLNAAEEAGFPSGIRLLEEPQAAFYCWLEQYSATDPMWERLATHAAELQHVLVVDIGGGTSDFSLFELRPGPLSVMPDIRRVAVSEHILLGGDNIDLALAVLLEPRLMGERGQISGPRWDHLVASCRHLKEQALSGSTSANEQLTVALPGRGASLVAGTQAVTLARDEVVRLVLDGFFPACEARARPYRTQAGLRDWGLPYATDGAVTRHLADFLKGRPRVDFVLFNGGTLQPALVRQRLLEQVATWQGGIRPTELENSEPDLAVARGAARFGKLLRGHSGRIAAGAARAVFLQVQTAQAATHQTVPPALICVLPRNAPPEHTFEVNLPGLEVRTGQMVNFQACSSTRHGRCQVGDVLPWDAEAFHALPPLQTVINTGSEPGVGSGRTVPVRLAAKMNSLGLLQISCVSTDPLTPRSWPLEWNLRPHEHDREAALGWPASMPIQPNATAEAQQAARDLILTTFARPTARSGRLTANGVLGHLERIVGLPRHEWNAALLRNLWPGLNERMNGRKLSVEHEEAWLTLAGFMLRPGFGFAHDALRMDELWRLRDAGLCFPGKRSRTQAHILWRRVAGGLTAERQAMLLAGELDSILAGKAAPELVRLSGSLERLPRETKTDLIETFIAQVLKRVEAKQHCTPYLAALGFLLNRVPIYSGPETVLPPEFVARAYTAFEDLDWIEPELVELQNLFLRAARVVDDRNLDVPKSLRDRIAYRLEAAGVTRACTATVRAFTPVGRIDRTALYGEALPAGLVLGADPDFER
ncbi:hsp70 family protein [Paracraurococcus lichenis]|uniref:Hsp70 family protein n=1 Tax=Paracraurococcus lichenis TaxID=3064888 RepID=A0ABT9ED06_9PROT|nr:hsp70 family protein [Paracraurococcus sp. LOR1-02]MDO9714100.1 Hsp70 family protein [Paracraurococcus sp. LOR1-02]